jgi:LuxR family transcriptional regulator, quorum-sensing system regulator BjaR1
VRGDFLAALEFAQKADAEQDPAELQRRFGEVVAQFGVKYFSTVVAAVPGQLLRPRFLFGQVDDGWTARYLARGYAQHDPTVHTLFETRKPFTWREAADRHPSEEGERLLSEVAEFTGASEALVVPIHDQRGETAAVILSGSGLDVDPAVRPILHLASVYFSSVGRDLVDAPDRTRDCPLTERQLECLKWVMDGKSDWEIGEILSISERTAHNHVEAAKRLLEVGTRTQAVVQAWRRGWLV